MQGWFDTGASTAASGIDLLFWAVTAVAAFFSLIISAAIVWFAVKYRRGNKVDRSNPPQYNEPLELGWTIIPLGIALALFLGGAALFFVNSRPPKDAMEIYVVGKQWMWKLQHPEGRWENNELHVPVGRPVLLVMTSEDVIHSFFVPAFRLKQDVIPGQYTQLWFQATKTGRYRLFCAEFCGTLHSKMTGWVTVMEPADYERWLQEGSVSGTLAAAGARLFQQRGCFGCHGPNGSVRAPPLEGIYGQPIPVQVRRPGVPLEKTPATTVIANQRYIHDSILLPEKEIAAGYRPLMPTFKGQLKEEQIMQLVAYIRSLANKPPPPARPKRSPAALSPEDYKARTGFVPSNVGKGDGAGRRGGARANERRGR